MQQVKINGSTVHYWVFNPAKPKTIVMVHGFRGTHHGLQRVIDKLPDYKIIVPDLPGFGDSTPLNTTHTVDAYVDFLHEFIKKVTTKKPALLGHSFGAIVASHYAATHPQSIQQLILLNAIAAPVLNGPRKVASSLAVAFYWMTQKLPPKQGRALLGNRAIVLGMSAFMTKTKDKTLRKEIHQSHLQHFSTFYDTKTLNQVFKTSITHTAADRAEQISVPTLIIAGELDDFAPLKGQYALVEKIHDARLIVIPHVGHLTQHEAPDQAAKAICDFVA